MDTPHSDSDFQPRHLVRHLWMRRWLLVAIPVLAFAGAWFGAQARRGTTYESRATVLVRTPARLSAEDRTPMGYNPPAFRGMFTADATLDRARRAHGWDGPIEAWRGRFTAMTSTEVDNTVATEYAPMVELRARGGSAEEAVTLMAHWTAAIVEQYGDLYADEARAASMRAQARGTELAAQYAEAAAEEETQRLRHRSAVARSESIARLLDGPLPSTREMLGDTLAPYGFTGGATWPAREGERAVEDAPSLFLTRVLGDMRNRTAEDQLSDLRMMQEEVAVEAASAAGGLAAAAARRMRLEHALRTNASAAAQAEARFPLDDASGAEPGTLRVLSAGVKPGGTRGRAPHMTALMAAMAVLVLTVVVFGGEAYVRYSVVRGS